MSDPNAPDTDRTRTPDEDTPPRPPRSTDENEPGKGAGRNTEVQRPAEDQTKQPTKKDPGAK